MEVPMEVPGEGDGYLAADIVEAIVERAPAHCLTVRRLLRWSPRRWADQHTAFGFTR